MMTGDRSGEDLATISMVSCLVETRPFSYEWLNHPGTISALAVKPAKTISSVMVGKED